MIFFPPTHAISIITVHSVLGSRRESQSSMTGPPATDPLGSGHTLQLDIMDDIVQARKARMKLWNTSNEKVCEVQTVNESGVASSSTRYTNAARRYSDFVGSSLTPIPSGSQVRRASENPAIATPSTSGTQRSRSPSIFNRATGIVVTNTDLKSLISSLASSATEINKCGNTTPTRAKPSTSSASNTLAPDPDGITRSNRSNSFDVSILHGAKQRAAAGSSSEKSGSSLAGWFERRHQPMSRKKSIRNPANLTVSFSKEVIDRFKDKEDRDKTKKSKSKLRWDNKGSFVDPHIIGNAIEGFLRKSAGKAVASRYKRSAAAATKPSTWFGKSDEDDSKDSCDSGLCSTLKDLFVK